MRYLLLICLTLSACTTNERANLYSEIKTIIEERKAVKEETEGLPLNPAPVVVKTPTIKPTPIIQKGVTSTIKPETIICKDPNDCHLVGFSCPNIKGEIREVVKDLNKLPKLNDDGFLHLPNSHGVGSTKDSNCKTKYLGFPKGNTAILFSSKFPRAKKVYLQHNNKRVEFEWAGWHNWHAGNYLRGHYRSRTLPKQIIKKLGSKSAVLVAEFPKGVIRKTDIKNLLKRQEK